MPLSVTRYLLRGHLYLFLIILFATAATLVSMGLTYRNSLQAARDSLELQAIGIAVSLEASLAGSIEKGGNILQGMVTAGNEGIAYAALYSREGRIILHSNSNLVGRRITNPAIAETAKSKIPSSGYIVLGTGEKIFSLDFPVQIKEIEGETAVLRLGLHTYPVEGIVRQAQLQAMIMSVVLAILWVMGYFIVRAVKKAEELQGVMAERERLAVIGEMASVLAHEIRNPLGSIKGFAQYLREQNKAGMPQNTAYMDIIISESERLEILTEDLLSYARPPEMRKERFLLQELLEELLKMARQPFGGEGKEIETSIPEGLEITTDRDRLRAVLENLIRNALDAVTAGGLVRVAASETPAG
ncbi:MAG: hypothetical protein HGA78_11830, partial [Nitrospirales bacterium]|nr:hypothetical protein [Nitrospirales bacterium]